LLPAPPYGGGYSGVTYSTVKLMYACSLTRPDPLAVLWACWALGTLASPPVDTHTYNFKACVVLAVFVGLRFIFFVDIVEELRMYDNMQREFQTTSRLTTCKWSWFDTPDLDDRRKGLLERWGLWRPRFTPIQLHWREWRDMEDETGKKMQTHPFVPRDLLRYIDSDERYPLVINGTTFEPNFEAMKSYCNELNYGRCHKYLLVRVFEWFARRRPFSWVLQSNLDTVYPVHNRYEALRRLAPLSHDDM